MSTFEITAVTAMDGQQIEPQPPPDVGALLTRVLTFVPDPPVIFMSRETHKAFLKETMPPDFKTAMKACSEPVPGQWVISVGSFVRPRWRKRDLGPYAPEDKRDTFRLHTWGGGPLHPVSKRARRARSKCRALCPLVFADQRVRAPNPFHPGYGAMLDALRRSDNMTDQQLSTLAFVFPALAPLAPGWALYALTHLDEERARRSRIAQAAPGSLLPTEPMTEPWVPPVDWFHGGAPPELRARRRRTA